MRENNYIRIISISSILIILTLLLIGTLFQRERLLHSLESDNETTLISDVTEQTDITKITLYYCGRYIDGTLYARETTIDSSGNVTTSLRSGETLSQSSTQEYLLSESTFLSLADKITSSGYYGLPASTEESANQLTSGYYIYIIISTQTATYRRGGFEADQESETIAALCKQITDTTGVPLFVTE